ncbi:hypothetical protein H9N25_12535 [Pedobacter riviphilus]|uniref:Uncharacterized protein n=1 Tax=Pedobacter riviphilus TaxID=2766984 RepID=A0ABX6TC90_9SPHI|nr:hypothetical protein [Pedobacter riviphilus]QNR82821.1 hypothetical protein H9N25_12535 [Pedobacter riviphilus]
MGKSKLKVRLTTVIFTNIFMLIELEIPYLFALGWPDFIVVENYPELEIRMV